MATQAGIVKQVQEMFYGKKYSVEQIAESLRVDAGVVAVAVQSAGREVIEQLTKNPSEDDKALIARTEKGITRHLNRAAEILGESLDCYDHPAIQLDAAKFITKIGLGMHRSVGDRGLAPSVNTFNVLIQQGTQIAQQHETETMKDGVAVFRPVNSPAPLKPKQVTVEV